MGALILMGLIIAICGIWMLLAAEFRAGYHLNSNNTSRKRLIARVAAFDLVGGYKYPQLTGALPGHMVLTTRTRLLIPSTSVLTTCGCFSRLKSGAQIANFRPAQRESENPQTIRYGRTCQTVMNNRRKAALTFGWLLLFRTGVSESALGFEHSTEFSVGRNPISIALGDVNGDGIDDLVTANCYASTVSLLQGSGVGTFGLRKDYAVGSCPSAVVFADLNTDGVPDVVTVNESNSDVGDSTAANTVSVLIGMGDGSLGPRGDYPVGLAPESLAVADLNGDGKLDVVTANSAPPTLSVLLGKGDGTLNGKVDYPVGDLPLAVTLGDVNGDGKVDALLASAGAEGDGPFALSVRLGQGDGSFQPKVDCAVSSRPSDITLADVNGDGKPDVILAKPSNHSVSVFLGQGDGAFQTEKDYAAYFGPRSLAVIDVDGDDKLDIVTANSFATGYSSGAAVDTPGTVSVLLGQGDGSFQLKGSFGESSYGIYEIDVAVGDLNRDGKLDTVTTNARSNTVVVMLGKGGGTFEAMGNYPVSASGLLSVDDATYSSAFADLNGDGKMDVIAGKSRFGGGCSLAVMLGQGDGTLQFEEEFAVGCLPWSIALGDLNGDNKMDAVTANPDSNTVSVVLGEGNGRFGTKADYAIEGSTYSVALGTINGDNKPDIIAVNTNANAVAVFIGNGDGTFQAKADYAVNGRPAAIALADLNGDKKADAVTGNGDTNMMSVLLGQGDGSFLPSVSYPVERGPSSVSVADVNGDGKLDAVTANQDSNSISILLGNGDGTFHGGISYPVNLRPTSIALADLDGDGNLDIVAVNSFSDSLSILLGSGDGTFQPTKDYSIHSGSLSLSVSLPDLNGDHKPDVVITNAGGGGSLSVLLNRSELGISLGHYDPFGEQLVGTRSAPQAVTLTNVGTAAYALQAITADGDFAVSHNCRSSLAASASCSLQVTFAPTAAGVRSGHLIVSGTSGDSLVRWLRGTGTVPLVSLGEWAPFGNQLVGTRSAPQAVTLTNLSTAAYAPLTITADGDFAVSHNCGSSLAAGASCSLQVTFTPTAAGFRSGHLIVSGTFGDPLVRTLSGIGVESLVSLGYPKIFGSQLMGTRSAPFAIPLANVGTEAYTLQAITADGDFAVSHNCGSSLAAGASCSLQVTFAPTAAGIRSGHLTVSGTFGDPLVRTLSGTGVYSVPADLAIKVAAPRSAQLGKRITYTVILKSRTSRKIPGVIVTGTLAAGASYARVPAYCGVAGQTLTCHLNTLRGKQRKVFSIIVGAGAKGSLLFTATASAEINESNLANNKGVVYTRIR